MRIRFLSRRFPPTPARLPRIHHQSELTKRDWENSAQPAVQGLSKVLFKRKND